jgi:hypothetical protein
MESFSLPLPRVSNNDYVHEAIAEVEESVDVQHSFEIGLSIHHVGLEGTQIQSVKGKDES